MSPAVRTQGGRSSARESNLTNPELKGLDSALGGALGAVLLTLADSELIIGHRHSEWTGFAPSAEEDVAFSSIAQDEMGHAHLYYALIAGAEEESVDRLALNPAPRSFRHLPIWHAGAPAGATASVADLRSEFVIRYRSGLVRAGVDDGTIDRVRLALGAGPATKPRGIPGWSAVHRDLTALRRAHPGASW